MFPSRISLTTYGTSKPCKRFDVGNTIELIIINMIRNFGFYVDELPNARRIDLRINNNYDLSIKYSSSGNIKLHNSNNCVNKDNKLTDLILITGSKLYLITKEQLLNYKINITKYLINTGDGLQMKRSVLTELKKKKYEFIKDFYLNIDKSKCLNKSCYKTFYNGLMLEYKMYKKQERKKQIKKLLEDVSNNTFK